MNPKTTHLNTASASDTGDSKTTPSPSPTGALAIAPTPSTALPAPEQHSEFKIQNSPLRKTGRPSSYSEALGAQLCEAIATSTRTLAEICADVGISSSMFYRYLHNEPIFRQHYERAKEVQAHLLCDEILKCADDRSQDLIDRGDGRRVPNLAAVHRSKLQIESRKHVLAKLYPRKFGEKIETGIDKWQGLTLDQFEERIREYQARQPKPRTEH